MFTVNRYESLEKSRLNTLRKIDALSGIDLIKYAIGKYYSKRVGVGFSGGLDSLAVTLMVLDTVPEETKVYVVFNNTTNEFPDSLKYTREMLKWFNEHYDNVKAVELMPKKHYNEFLFDNFDKGAKFKLKHRWDKKSFICCYNLKEKPAFDYYKEKGIKIRFTGLRGSESMYRFYHMYQYKGLHKDKHGFIHVMPLWNWSRIQTFEYVRDHPLKPPINPIYSKDVGGTGCMLCPVKFYQNTSKLRNLKKYYPRAYKIGIVLKRYFLSKYQGIKPLVIDDHPILKKVREWDKNGGA